LWGSTKQKLYCEVTKNGFVKYPQGNNSYIMVAPNGTFWSYDSNNQLIGSNHYPDGTLEKPIIVKQDNKNYIVISYLNDYKVIVQIDLDDQDSDSDASYTEMKFKLYHKGKLQKEVLSNDDGDPLTTTLNFNINGKTIKYLQYTNNCLFTTYLDDSKTSSDYSRITEAEKKDLMLLFNLVEENVSLTPSVDLKFTYYGE
jgi:hypothetical protein